MSVSAAVQKAIYAVLSADAGLTALVAGRVYDRVPTNAVFPYVSLGPDSFIADDAECIEAEEGFVQIDAWSRSVGQVEAKRITGAIKAVLHEHDLEVEDPYATAICRVRQIRHFQDQDGLTTHGVVTVDLIVEITDG